MRDKSTKYGSSKSSTMGFESTGVPLYYQLQSILLEKIHSGTLPDGGRFPTEAELVKEYGVSRITVREALRTIEELGLIRREVGRGTFVTDHRPFTGSLKLEGSMNELISLGVATTIKVLRVTTVKASEEVAELLRIKPGSLVSRCTRVRFHNNDAFSHVVIDLPYELGQQLTTADWKRPVSRVLQEKLKIDLIEAQQNIRASLADAELARRLGTRIGAALLAVDRLVLTHGRRPVERVVTHYRSDVFCFKVHLHRDDPDDGWKLKNKNTKKNNGTSEWH
jgi:GntR family transcriptional regulator